MANTPSGRRPNVSGTGSDVHKKGDGLGTGPVGQNSGTNQANHRRTGSSSGSSGGPSRAALGGGSGLLIIIVLFFEFPILTESFSESSFKSKETTLSSEPKHFATDIT